MLDAGRRRSAQYLADRHTAARHVAAAALLAAFGLACLPGCGYRVAGISPKAPAGIKTLTIRTLGNRTKQQELEQLLTRALVQEISERSNIKVNISAIAGDAVLQGDILSFTATPILFSAETFASTFLVTIQVSLKLTQDGGKKVIFENPDLVFRDQYVISSSEKQYFSELSPALRRIARDFASSVATTILTGW
jgi:hypothetical protein